VRVVAKGWVMTGLMKMLTEVLIGNCAPMTVTTVPALPLVGEMARVAVRVEVGVLVGVRVIVGVLVAV